MPTYRGPDPWKLFSSSLLDVDDLGILFVCLFFSEGICSSRCLLHGEQERAGEFMSLLWAHSLDSFIESEAQETNFLGPKPSLWFPEEPGGPLYPKKAKIPVK